MIELKGLRYETVSAYKGKNNEIENSNGITNDFEIFRPGSHITDKLRTTE